MYKLVHTHTKTEVGYALNYATRTIQVSPQCQTCSKSREKYRKSCNPQETQNQTQIKIFFSF